MLSTIWTFVCRMAWNAFIAFFIALIPWLIISFVLWIALIPVHVVSGGLSAILSSLIQILLYKIMYIWIFLDLMFEDYHLPSLSNRLQRWWNQFRQSKDK